MGTVYHEFSPLSALPASSDYPTLDVVSGTNFPVAALDFHADTNQTCFFLFHATSYGSGNLTLTIHWYAATGSSSTVIWGAALAVITPNTDTQDIETKAFATAQTATDTHLGTTNKRLHAIDITISNLDSIAAGDYCVLKVYRDAVTDGMSGKAKLVKAVLSYSDT